MRTVRRYISKGLRGGADQIDTKKGGAGLGLTRIYEMVDQVIVRIEESLENKTILIGTPEQVAEEVQFYRDLLGLEHLTIFPHLLGDSYAKANEQMTRFAEEVVPLLG